MKIDSKLTFVRIIVANKPIDGEFRIVKGSGDLSSEVFVEGIASAKYDDGTLVKAPIVYPYRMIERLIVELPKPTEEAQ